MSELWKDELKENISTLEEISEALEIDTSELAPIVERHPMNITKYYLSLINKNDPDDPIRKMSVPSNAELDDSGLYDTSGEGSNTVLDGVQHKYPQTSLVLTTNICYMYCRHCFRKRMVGYTQEEIASTMNEAINYIKEHKEIDNILLSGGDSLAIPNSSVEEYLKHLTEIDHLDFIRFGSRIPVVLPSRIYSDQELLDIFEKYNKKKRIILVTQFNHPKEITEEAVKAIDALLDINVQVLNQTVLLKGINDNVETMTALMKKLMRNRITPYYIFQCRPVKHVKNHFQIPIAEGVDIINAVRDNLGGPSKQFRFAMSHNRGKIEILGKIDDKVVFKFAQAKNRSDANQMFMKDMENAGWLDDDLNPIIG